MQKSDLYSADTGKTIRTFLGDLEPILNKNDFIVINKATMDMAASFKAHGAATNDEFDLHMVQICKPDKAAKSLAANLERSVLMPKFIMLFSNNDRTQVRFLRFNPADIAAVIDDEIFPGSLQESFDKIVSMIEEARRA